MNWHDWLNFGTVLCTGVNIGICWFWWRRRR